MKDSNILTLINIVKNSEKSQKDRDAFIDFVSKRQPMEPKSLIKTEIEDMFQSVFITSTPEGSLSALLMYLENEDGENFLETFRYEYRRMSTLLYEYKFTKKALKSFFELIIYKALTSSSSFLSDLRSFNDPKMLPSMIGPMARPSDSEFTSDFSLDYIQSKDRANNLFAYFYEKGPLKLNHNSSSDSVLENLFRPYVSGYIYRDINALGTYTDKGSFCMIGFKGQNYNPSILEKENCTFSFGRYPLDSNVKAIDSTFSSMIAEKMQLLFATKKGENVNSSVGLDITFSSLIETLYAPIILSAVLSSGSNREVIPVKLIIDKQGTTVYVDALELFSVLNPLGYCLQGLKESNEDVKDVVDVYYDNDRNSLIISSDYSYNYSVSQINFEEGIQEEYTNSIPYCGEVRLMKSGEIKGVKTICSVDLTNLSPTITLKEKLSSKPVLVEYLEVPAKIYRENPGLKQFQEKENELLKIKSEEELYSSLLAFIEKYINTYSTLQKKTIVKQVGTKQVEGEQLVRWLDESKPQFNIKTNPNIYKYVLTVREAYWQNNTSLDIEKTLSYFVSKGTNPYYRLLCIQILGIDYLKFTEKIISKLIDDGNICISNMVITKDTGLPLYFGVLPYNIEYSSEYASGNVYEKIGKLERIELNIKTYFGNKNGSSILSNQKDLLEKSKPKMMKFRWGAKSEVIERYISNKDLSKEQKKTYKAEELRTITVNVNDNFIELYGEDTNIFGTYLDSGSFRSWLRGDGAKYISSTIQVNTLSDTGFALPNLIADAYTEPAQKGIFINSYLNQLSLGKRNYATGEVNQSEKKTIIIKVYQKNSGSAQSFVTLSKLESNKEGMLANTRETLQEWGYLDPDAEVYERDYTEHITVKKEDAKRLWSILETLYYEKTSDIKVEGQRLYNLFVRSQIKDKNIANANRRWNEMFNNFAKPEYSLIPIVIRHSYYFKNNTTSPFNLRGAQKQGLKFLNAYSDGGLLAHEVGFGKTTTAITKCAELIETGKAKRILTIVPNVVYDNWIQEISGGKDKEGNPIIGLLGNSVKVIPIGNLGLDALMGGKRPSRTVQQKAIIKKDGKRRGVKTYFDSDDKDEFDEVGAIKKATEIAKTILNHIGQYSRVRGAKLPGGKSRTSKLNDGGILRFSDRSLEGTYEVTKGKGYGTVNIQVDQGAEEFNSSYAKKNKDNSSCDVEDLVIGRRRFSGNADLSNFVEFVKEVIGNEIPNYTQSTALNSIVPDIIQIAEDIRGEWMKKLNEKDSDENNELKTAFGFANTKEFNIKKYCPSEYGGCNLNGCFDSFTGYNSYRGTVEQKPDFGFWINDSYTKLEKQITDRIIWYFRKLRGTLVGKMGKWKDWAILDKAILIATHTAVENLKVPQIYVNQAILDASDTDKIDKASDFYKGFSLPLRHNSIDIQQLNVDAVIVDEVHNFNRIIDKVNKRASWGGPYKRLYGKAKNNQEDGAQTVMEYSFKSNSLPTVNKFNMFALCKYIQSVQEGMQNTILLSATPFTDDNYQLLSIFNMVNKKRMDSLGINNSYEFYMKYVVEEWKWDINQRNQFGLFAKVEGYNNGYALSSFIKSFGNFKISDKEIERRRPIKYTISSSQQSLEVIKDVVSIIDLTDIQERMVKNISEYTNGNTTTVNEYGYDEDMISKMKLGKIASSKEEQFVDQEEEERLQEEILEIASIESFSTNAKEKFFILSNLNPNSVWVQNFKEDNPTFFDGEEESTDQTDGSEAVKSGALGNTESTAKAFRGQSLNLKLAISPYLISGNKDATAMNPLLPAFTKNQSNNAKNFVEQSPKINYAVKCSLELLLHHKSKGESPSGQVMYLNLYRFKYGGIVQNIFDLIKKYMVDLCEDPKSKYFGLLEEENISSLTSDTTSKNREDIKNKFLSGEVLILMGTETIKEGINLQENATIMYILNAEFSPVKMMQLQGRIWRQGNNWKNCFIINVLARKSLDAFVFSKLDRKITAVREMLDSDVYEMDATQFTMDAHQIKIELTTDVKQLVKIGWIEKEKELESIRIQENVRLRSLESLKENYISDIEKSKELRETFNALSIVYSKALREEMIKKIQRKQDKISKEQAIAKKQKSIKTPLTADQIKMVKYSRISEKDAELLINDTEDYTLKFSHQDLIDETLNYVVLSTQLKKLLDGLLIVDSEYINIDKINDLSESGVAGKSKEFKAQVSQAKFEIKQIKKDLTEAGIDYDKLTLGRRMIREMIDLGYTSRYKWYEANFLKFEEDVDKLIGGTGIAKTLSDYSVYIEGEGKNFGDIDSLIKKQQVIYNLAENLSKDAVGQKAILEKEYKKQMKAKNDPKKKVTIDKALARFKKIFPLIEKK